LFSHTKENRERETYGFEEEEEQDGETARGRNNTHPFCKLEIF
jgi:hypothetical protein